MKEIRIELCKHLCSCYSGSTCFWLLIFLTSYQCLKYCDILKYTFNILTIFCLNCYVRNFFQYSKSRLEIIRIFGMPKISALYIGNTTVLKFCPAMPLHDGFLNIEIDTRFLSKFIFHISKWHNLQIMHWIISPQ
jgi:hypothetical protein